MILTEKKKIINGEFKMQIYYVKDLQAHPLMGWRFIFLPWDDVHWLKGTLKGFLVWSA